MVNLKKIKDVAQRQGKTLTSIADAVGITPTGLSLIIRENSTKVDTLQKIADFLQVPVGEFFTDGDYKVATNSNTGSVGGDFSVGSDMTRVLEILDSQLKTKDEQLRSKDEQINALIKALNG